MAAIVAALLKGEQLEAEMEIRSVLVNVGPDATSSNTLQYAIDLARTFDAELIGAAADQPIVSYAAIDGGAMAIDIYNTLREDIERRLGEAGEAFKAAVPAGMRSSWTAAVENSTGFLIETAISADVIVTASNPRSGVETRQHPNLGELILSSGRPVLAVANQASVAKFGKVLIGWKDTREARRAVSDALPFLTRASQVMAITVSEGDVDQERRSLAQLAAWLARHGVVAKTQVVPNPEAFDDIIETMALTEEADLLVSGGYGHSRMREWLFGGVTRNLLAAHSVSRFFSN
jgi:nucleotide-binding universal stress UspA family protein